MKLVILDNFCEVLVHYKLQIILCLGLFDGHICGLGGGGGNDLPCDV